jgi:hypothetical protein
MERERAPQRRRPERLFVSLNAREKAVIEEAANEAELNMTEWARGVLLERARKDARRIKREATMSEACDAIPVI